MKSYLKRIVLFGKDNTKRIVHLYPGVNIITGDSKTGKSALVEIIDYCLCSAQCSVPKGRITEYTSLFSIVMSINDIDYLISREAAQDGGYMYIQKLTNELSIDDISYEYISCSYRSTPKEVQYKIEAALGMNITNINGADEAGEKPSLRNMVSYMFQHQNLIASKFALFYRFTDSNKRKDVINQFPVFAGFVDQCYYSDLIRLDTLKSQLRSKKMSQSRISKQINYANTELLPLLENYYALFGKPLPAITSSAQLFVEANNLPQFDDTQLFEEDGIVSRYHSLNMSLAELKEKKQNVLQQMETLETTESHGNSYGSVLIDLQEKTAYSTKCVDNYSCPLCGTYLPDLQETDEEIEAAKNWLAQELIFSQNYSASFAEDIRKLKEQLDIISNQIRNTYHQIRQIEQKYIKSHELLTKREKLVYARTQIKLYLDTSKFSDDDELVKEIARLEHEIQQLRNRIDGYAIEKMLRDAENFLNTNMNTLAKTLDFEDEYKPVDLNFTLIEKTFDLFQHQQQHEKIYLYEMGSGANWLSCHVALFLSFLHYFAKQKKSPMPLIMFLDQPSQVYFPNGLTSDSKSKVDTYSSDLAAVNRIYQTIFDEAKHIQEDTAILPQIIIVDHVDSSIMKDKGQFAAALRCDWRDGKKLI